MHLLLRLSKPYFVYSTWSSLPHAVPRRASLTDVLSPFGTVCRTTLHRPRYYRHSVNGLKRSVFPWHLACLIFGCLRFFNRFVVLFYHPWYFIVIVAL